MAAAPALSEELERARAGGASEEALVLGGALLLELVLAEELEPFLTLYALPQLNRNERGA